MTAHNWRDDAACLGTDPEAFFPGKHIGAGPAREICKRCPVRSECLNTAIANDEGFGIFGGLNRNERKALQRRRKLPA